VWTSRQVATHQLYNIIIIILFSLEFLQLFAKHIWLGSKAARTNYMVGFANTLLQLCRNALCRDSAGWL